MRGLTALFHSMFTKYDGFGCIIFMTKKQKKKLWVKYKLQVLRDYNREIRHMFATEGKIIRRYTDPQLFLQFMLSRRHDLCTRELSLSQQEFYEELISRKRIAFHNEVQSSNSALPFVSHAQMTKFLFSIIGEAGVDVVCYIDSFVSYHPCAVMMEKDRADEMEVEINDLKYLTRQREGINIGILQTLDHKESFMLNIPPQIDMCGDKQLCRQLRLDYLSNFRQIKHERTQVKIRLRELFRLRKWLQANKNKMFRCRSFAD